MTTWRDPALWERTSHTRHLNTVVTDHGPAQTTDMYLAGAMARAVLEAAAKETK